MGEKMYKLVLVGLIAAAVLPTDAFILSSFNIQKSFGASVPAASSASSSKYIPATSSVTTFDANALIQSKVNTVTSLINSLVQFKTSLANSLVQTATNAVTSASQSVSNLSAASSQTPGIFTKTVTFNKGLVGVATSPAAVTVAAPAAAAQPSSGGYAYRTYKYRA